MQILLANPRGFCAGVDRAIDIVERAIELFGAPIYVRHEVVHNRFVVDRLRALGAVFVEELDEVPDDATVIFSAHGVSRAVQDEARRRGLRVFDATCPLVTKVHMEVARYAREGRDVILIGHEGHPEVEGTMGQFDDSQRRTHPAGGGRRTTSSTWTCAIRRVSASSRRRRLSVDDTADVLDALQAALSDAGDAAQGRHLLRDAEPPGRGQEAGRACDVVIVVGSQTSSNSNRLREIAEKAGIPGYLVDGPRRPAARVVRRQDARRRDGGRIGAGSAGGARRRAPARSGAGEGPDEVARPRGERRVRPAARTAIGSRSRPPSPGVPDA